jgi:putative tricarboxylic transport membrane protein
MDQTDRGPTAADEAPAQSRATPSFTGPRVVAAVLVGGGAFLVYQALQIGATLGYSVVGPSVVPIFVSIVLLVLGLILAARTTLVPDVDLAQGCGDEEAVTHWPTVGLLLVLIVAYAFALAPLGYIVATAILVPVAARVLGSDQPARDVGIGIGLAVVVYFGFTQFLQVRLPTGILGPLL